MRSGSVIVGAHVALVELEPLDHQGGADGLAVLYSDDALFPDLLHGLGDRFADSTVINGDGGYPGVFPFLYVKGHHGRFVVWVPAFSMRAA